MHAKARRAAGSTAHTRPGRSDGDRRRPRRRSTGYGRHCAEAPEIHPAQARAGGGAGTNRGSRTGEPRTRPTAGTDYGAGGRSIATCNCDRRAAGPGNPAAIAAGAAGSGLAARCRCLFRGRRTASGGKKAARRRHRRRPSGSLCGVRGCAAAGAGARDAARPGGARRAIYGCRGARRRTRQEAERRALEFGDRGAAQQRADRDRRRPPGRRGAGAIGRRRCFANGANRRFPGKPVRRLPCRLVARPSRRRNTLPAVLYKPRKPAQTTETGGTLMPKAHIRDGELRIALSDEMRAKLAVHEGEELEAHVFEGSVTFTRRDRGRPPAGRGTDPGADRPGWGPRRTAGIVARAGRTDDRRGGEDGSPRAAPPAAA